MKRVHGWQLLALPSISFGLLVVPLLARWTNWLCLVALVPLVYFCQHATKLSPKTITRAIYWPGLVYGLATYAWILQTSPSSWTALQGNLTLLIKALVWLAAALTVSVHFWLLGRFVAHFRKQPVLLLWSLPVIWALAELARVYSFAVAGYGPGGSLSPNWNLGLAGLGAMATPLAYASRLVGLYGMSMVVVGVNTALFLLAAKHARRVAALMLASVVALAGFGYLLYQPTGPAQTVAALHLEAKGTLEKGWPADTAKTDEAGPLKDAQLVVLPEYSLFFKDPNHAAFSRQQLRPDATIITSVASTEQPSRNILTMYRPDKGVVSQQSKTFLIAGGEYMPYLFSGFFSAINQSYLTRSFNDSQQVRRGALAEQPVQLGNTRVGSLVCSGVLALNEYRRLTDNGAQVLTNSASLSLLAGASLYHEQESYLTRFHAVSNARPFVQASRSGESYIMNSNGHYLATARGENKLLRATVQTSAKKTVYSQVGEWTLLAGPLLLLMFRKRLI